MSDVAYIDVIDSGTVYIDVNDDDVEIIEIGIPGPPGLNGNGEEEVPTFPVVDPKSHVNLAAGVSQNLDSVVIPNGKTGKAQQITLSSSAACKWEVKKSTGGIDTTLDVIFTSGNTGNEPSHEWEPPHRDYTSLVGNGSTTFYRVTATNLDARNAANVYVTFFFDEVNT